MSKEWVWDGRTQRYRDRSTGKFLKNAEVTQLIEYVVEAKQDKLQASLNGLLQGRVSLLDFQIEARQTIKYMHTQNYLVGKGGFAKTTSEEYLKVARDLKEVHYPAFRDYVNDLKEGRFTPAQARARLDNFFTASKSQYNYGRKQSAKDNGFIYAQRFLSAAEHCYECPIYAALGVVRIDELIMPGERCTCRFNCKCYVQYYKKMP